jgi:hypothetical protein
MKLYPISTIIQWEVVIDGISMQRYPSFKESDKRLSLSILEQPGDTGSLEKCGVTVPKNVPVTSRCTPIYADIRRHSGYRRETSEVAENSGVSMGCGALGVYTDCGFRV